MRQNGALPFIGPAAMASHCRDDKRPQTERVKVSDSGIRQFRNTSDTAAPDANCNARSLWKIRPNFNSMQFLENGSLKVGKSVAYKILPDADKG